jgi:hypothetical protein
MRKALLVLVLVLLLSACSVFAAKSINQKANADPYEATSAQARPDVESHIELSDGAGISIPAGALSAEITVKVERNPEKAQKLPPLDEGLLPVSNFYNFEIAGGVLNDRVDLTLPFDKSLIPDDQKNGFLVAAVPNETGWSYVPVEPTGDKVILWTDQIGDPIIAWHFVDEENYPLLCSPYMDIQIDPQAGTSGTEFTVVGRVKTIKPTFLEEILGRNTKKEAANIPVSIYLSPVNYIEEHNAALTVTTDDSGYFSAKLPGEITPGWWYLRAEAKCVLPEGTLFKKISGSEGRVTFRVMPEDVQAVDSPTQEADVVPTVKVNPQATVSPIPSGAIQIPDVVGLSLDDAVKKLENLGFGVTWVDGKSSLELGQIYQQKPAAGEYFVPHRTTVVVYRTLSKIVFENPTELKLSKEELANSLKHSYHFVIIKCEVIKPFSSHKNDLCENLEEGEEDIQFIFSHNSVLMKNKYYEIPLTKTTNNTYSNGTSIISFSIEGFSYEYEYVHHWMDSNDAVIDESFLRYRQLYVIKE